MSRKKPKWRWLLLPLSPIAIPIGFIAGIILGLRHREPVRFVGKFGYLDQLGEIPPDGAELQELGEIPPDGAELQELGEIPPDGAELLELGEIPPDGAELQELEEVPPAGAELDLYQKLELANGLDELGKWWDIRRRRYDCVLRETDMVELADWIANELGWINRKGR